MPRPLLPSIRPRVKLACMSQPLTKFLKLLKPQRQRWQFGLGAICLLVAAGEMRAAGANDAAVDRAPVWDCGEWHDLQLFRYTFLPRLACSFVYTPCCVDGPLYATAGFAAETKVKLPSSRADLATGAKLFENQCARCHGPKGEGGRGPMLTRARLPHATDDASVP